MPLFAVQCVVMKSYRALIIIIVTIKVYYYYLIIIDLQILIQSKF